MLSFPAEASFQRSSQVSLYVFQSSQVSTPDTQGTMGSSQPCVLVCVVMIKRKRGWKVNLFIKEELEVKEITERNEY